jgi:hypothetical protein
MKPVHRLALISAALAALRLFDPPTASCCMPAPPNLVLWLPFDETSGNVSANLASPANYGTQVNHPTPMPGAYVANSLSFDGTSYVTVPDYTDIEIRTGDMTIDAWVYDTASPGTNNVILDKGSLTGAGYALWLHPNLGLILLLSEASFIQGTPISEQQWHFVAVSVNQSSGQAFFYVDGVAADTFPITPADLSYGGPLWVGASNPLGSEYGWVGALDEVEVYNRALSSIELDAIYNAGNAGKCKACCYLKVITITRVPPNSIAINWGGCGTLEEAPTPFGPWTAIQNPPSPYVIPLSAAALRFYRLVCP